MEKIYDVSVPIKSGMAVYQGDPEVIVDHFASIKRGDAYNMVNLNLSSHAGTHVDAPCHFFTNGKAVDEIAFELLMGPVKVITLRNQKSINKKLLQEYDLGDARRVFFRTDHSFMSDRYSRFRSSYVYLEVDACGYLVQKGIKLVGIDSFSVEKFGSQDHMCHKVLLGAGIVIVELLDLKDVESGDYEMICLPLRVYKGDGAPARVILKAKS